MLIVVFSYECFTPLHLLRGDGRQRPSGQIQPVHDGLETLEGQWSTVVVHLYNPVRHIEISLNLYFDKCYALALLDSLGST